MQASLSHILVITTLSMCGNSGSESNSNSTDDIVTASGYTCGDSRIIMDVELMVARECSDSSECQQVLFEGDLQCEANSFVASNEYESSYLYDLYDDAVEAGCNYEVNMNQDCSLTTIECVNSKCMWQ